MEEMLTCRKCGCQTWMIFADRVRCVHCGCDWSLSPLRLMDREADKEPEGVVREEHPGQERQPQAPNGAQKDAPTKRQSLSSPEYFSEHVLPKLRPTSDGFQAAAYANWRPEASRFWDDETQRLYVLWLRALSSVNNAILSAMSDQKGEHYAEKERQE